MRKLIDSAIIIALFTALLYAVSSAYRNGYLREIGLNENILDIDFHHSVYLGFVLAFTGFMGLLGKNVAVIIWGFVFFSFAIYFFLTKVSRINKPIKRWLAVKNWTILTAEPSNHQKGMGMPFNLIIAGLVFSALLLLLLAHFEQKGKNYAKEQLKIATQNKSPQQESISLSINGKPKELKLLVCGARNCAGYDHDSNRIYYFPQQIMSFTPKAP